MSMLTTSLFWIPFLELSELYDDFVVSNNVADIHKVLYLVRELVADLPDCGTEIDTTVRASIGTLLHGIMNRAKSLERLSLVCNDQISMLKSGLEYKNLSTYTVRFTLEPFNSNVYKCQYTIWSRPKCLPTPPSTPLHSTTLTVPQIPADDFHLNFPKPLGEFDVNDLFTPEMEEAGQVLVRLSMSPGSKKPKKHDFDQEVESNHGSGSESSEGSYTLKKRKNLKSNGRKDKPEYPSDKKLKATGSRYPEKVQESLRNWLDKHVKHPYPSDADKKKLATENNLTVTQVNNWFINARRRYL